MHGAPLTELNEYDARPPPPSYWSIDISDPDPNETRYPGLMLAHVLSMVSAFFFVLPAGIALRSVNHAWHAFSVIVFWALVIFGCAMSGIYTKLTPNMYEHQMHSSLGYWALFVALVLTGIDIASGFSRLLSYVNDVRSGERFSFHAFWSQVVLSQDSQASSGRGAEYTNLVVGEPEEMEMEEDLKSHNAVVFDDTEEPHDGEEAQWANQYPQTPNSERTVFERRALSSDSHHSDDTLHIDYQHPRSKRPFASKYARVGRIVFAVVERTLVFAGFALVTSGIAVYTGGCRDYRINTCLAHVIKGGIFWCYGLVTFARFLGAFSEVGWAWNRAPKGRPVSAEFVESAVIFTYGITNVWMERFGAAPGSPFTTKQLQHISIAIMYWFAGLVGMGMESRRFRRWLSSFSTAYMRPRDRASGSVAEPASYASSLNPFPALCIGVTGIAMAAHAQNYVFMVQVHMLWGICLGAFAVLRWLTYFFVWLGPPRSILPSRPPSEAIGSFFLACGGLLFMLSSEDITVAAMRQGHDDMMLFANAAVAFTCFAFCWTMAIVGFKAWLKSRTHKTVTFHASA
ncbi:hypothetical protein K488DRAFT_77680 [Vararia minispora EC-137]|uniref:Uncharacterized protein n=1 Tax=Vararia minispora EC-137 TaxID=1314806 RepID=A0ACB8QQZ2_9AGAM|nr:hypothetical protein K488DRAFT_77680 [Vararia minispora EC-137]